MIKINGVKATSVMETQKEITPSINQILDKMENNFEARKVDYSQNNLNNIFDGSQNIDNSQNTNQYSQKVNSLGSFNALQNGDNSNLLLSILPMMLSKDKTSAFKKSQNEIMKQMLKKINNPMLAKLFELMPKLAKATSAETQNANVETNKKEKNIDEFVKAEDFQDNQK